MQGDRIRTEAFPKKKNVYFYEYSRHIPYVEDGGWAFAGLNKNPCAGRVLHGTFLLRMTKNQLRALANKNITEYQGYFAASGNAPSHAGSLREPLCVTAV